MRHWAEAENRCQSQQFLLRKIVNRASGNLIAVGVSKSRYHANEVESVKLSLMGEGAQQTTNFISSKLTVAHAL